MEDQKNDLVDSNPNIAAPVELKVDQIAKRPVGKKYIYLLIGIIFVVAISVALSLYLKNRKNITSNNVDSNKTESEKIFVPVKPDGNFSELQKEKIIYNYDDCSVFLSNFDGTAKTDFNVDFKYPFCGIAPNGNYYYYFGKADETHRQLCFHEIADKADKKDFCVEKSTNTDSATEQFFDIRWSSDGRFIVWRNNPDDASFKIADVTYPNVQPYFNENGDCQAYSWFPASNRLFCFGTGKFRVIDAEKFIKSASKDGIKEFEILGSGMKKIDNTFFSKNSPEIDFDSVSCSHIAISENQDKVVCNQARNLIQSEIEDNFFIADLNKKEYISGSGVDSGRFAFSRGGSFLIFSYWNGFAAENGFSGTNDVLNVQDLSSISEDKLSSLAYYGATVAGKEDSPDLKMLYSFGNIPNLYLKNENQLSMNQKFAQDAITTEKYAGENGLITAKDQGTTFVEINDPASQIKFNIPQNIFSAKREVKQVMWDQKMQDQEQWTITSNRNELIFLVIGINKTKDTIDGILKSYKEFDPNAQKVEIGGKTWIKASSSKVPIYATMYNGLQVGCSLAGEALANTDAQKIAEDIIASIWIK